MSGGGAIPKDSVTVTQSGTVTTTSSDTRKITTTDTFAIDAFGRWRVSNPVTLFDSKQLNDNLPLYWDQQVRNAGGTTKAVYSKVDSATTMTVSSTAGDYVIRQTKMRFNYQPGKSQQILSTFVLGTGVANVTKRVGYFNSDTGAPYNGDIDGLYLEQDGTTQYLVQSKNGTATRVAQASWNIDAFDGNGPSGVTLDWSKSQIMWIDFEWLGVGRVRLGFVVDGIIYYAHQFANANNLTSIYMSSSNHSLRYEIRSSGGTSSLVHICSSVASEGGEQPRGSLFCQSTSGTHITCATENTLYAIIGIRLKEDYLDITTILNSMALQLQTGSSYGEWLILLNPNVADGGLDYTDISNSAMQGAVGTATKTVTGGIAVSGGFIESGVGQGKSQIGSSGATSLENALNLGAKIDGTRDQFILAFRPIGGSTNVDVEGALFWRELI